MDYAQMIHDEVAAMERRLMQHVATLLQQTQFTNPTAAGNEDGVAGLPDSGGSYQPAVRRWQHFGFRSVPPANAGAIMALLGGSAQGNVTIAEDGEGYGPDPGAEGAALYSSKTGCYVILDRDGEINIVTPAGQAINITAGAGANVVVNGGGADVARATVDTAGPWPIVSGPPSRLKTSIL